MADLRASELPGRVSDRSTLVLPLGAIEQHGPHLPYSTDLIIADCAGAAVVDAVGDELDLWLLPSLAYTKSNEHAWNAGTVWLSATTMLAVLDDIGRSLAMTGVRKLALLNGHGGNFILLPIVQDLNMEFPGLLTMYVDPFERMVESGCPVSMSRISWPLAISSSRRGNMSSPETTATLRPGASRSTARAQASGFTPPALAITFTLRSTICLAMRPIRVGKSRA